MVSRAAGKGASHPRKGRVHEQEFQLIAQGTRFWCLRIRLVKIIGPAMRGPGPTLF